VAGRLKENQVVVSEAFPPADAAKAEAKADTGHARGKIILNVRDEPKYFGPILAAAAHQAVKQTGACPFHSVASYRQIIVCEWPILTFSGSFKEECFPGAKENRSD